MEERKKTDISSEEHTLFVSQIPEQKKLVDKKKYLYEIRPKYKVFTVYIKEFKELKRGLHTVLNELRSASKRDLLILRINSRGGSVTEGKQFYNLIQEKFHKRAVAYLDNSGYSMGALLFCMAKKRVIYPYSDIMFHNYSGGVKGKGSEIVSKVEHANKLLISFFKKVVVDKGFLSQSEFDQMVIGKDYWMDAEQMCKRNIATHIIYKGREIKAQKYLKKINSSNLVDKSKKQG
jgi:ATP-dependent protease ClpP protease subunit